MRRVPSRPRHPALLLCCFAICHLPAAGCLKHSIQVTSEPSGALVWINDVEAGRTPLETDFTFHGTYDVRLEREGYEPLITKADADAPIQEFPIIDLAAEAIPITFHNTIKWHYVLTPLAERTEPKEQAEQELIARARAERAQAPKVEWAPPSSAWSTGKPVKGAAKDATPENTKPADKKQDNKKPDNVQ